MKQDAQNDMKRVSVNVDSMQAFIITNKVGMKINAGVNAKNYQIKVCVIKDLFGIPVIVNVNVITHMILASIQTMQTLSAEKKLVDNLVEKCAETVEEAKLAKITIDSVNQNKALLKKYTDAWDGITNEIKAINGGKENNYRKDYMKI